MALEHDLLHARSPLDFLKVPRALEKRVVKIRKNDDFDYNLCLPIFDLEMSNFPEEDGYFDEFGNWIPIARGQPPDQNQGQTLPPGVGQQQIPQQNPQFLWEEPWYLMGHLQVVRMELQVEPQFYHQDNLLKSSIFRVEIAGGV